MLSLLIFDHLTGALILDASPFVQSCKVETGENGFAALSAEINIPLRRALQLFDRGAPLQMQVASGTTTVWEGRLEQAGIRSGRSEGGLSITAKGYASAMADVPYTAMWSDDSVGKWRPVLATEVANSVPDLFQFDTQNRIYIAPEKSSTQGVSFAGRMGYELPSGGTRFIEGFEFSYRFLAPAGWQVGIERLSSTWGFGSAPWTLNGTGALQTGSQNLTFAICDKLGVYLYNTAAAAVYTGETGDIYFEVTNVRVRGTSSTSIYADEIAKALVAAVATLNTTQLSTSTALIQSPLVNLTQETYEDEYPADILDRLAALGDTSARVWEWGVYEGKRLHFRPRGSAGNQWFVDVTSLELERVLGDLYNSAYAVYENANNDTIRGTTNTNATSIGMVGITRRQAVSVSTTSATQANYVRDTTLADTANPLPRASIEFDRVYTSTGAKVALWRVRAGDTITIRNLPPTLSATLDRIRTFRISRTSYDAIENTLTVEPEAPLPRVETYLARREAGIQ